MVLLVVSKITACGGREKRQKGLLVCRCHYCYLPGGGEEGWVVANYCWNWRGERDGGEREMTSIGFRERELLIDTVGERKLL